MCQNSFGSARPNAVWTSGFCQSNYTRFIATDERLFALNAAHFSSHTSFPNGSRTQHRELENCSRSTMDQWSVVVIPHRVITYHERGNASIRIQCCTPPTLSHVDHERLFILMSVDLFNKTRYFGPKKKALLPFLRKQGPEWQVQGSISYKSGKITVCSGRGIPRYVDGLPTDPVPRQPTPTSIIHQ